VPSVILYNSSYSWGAEGFKLLVAWLDFDAGSGPDYLLAECTVYNSTYTVHIQHNTGLDIIRTFDVTMHSPFIPSATPGNQYLPTWDQVSQLAISDAIGKVLQGTIDSGCRALSSLGIAEWAFRMHNRHFMASRCWR
jgi:hypothetical protein